MTFESLRQRIRLGLEKELKQHPGKDEKIRNEEDSDNNESTELTKRMMSRILRNVEFSLRRLQPLVRAGSSLLARAELGRVFADLVQGQMRHFFLWLNEIVQEISSARDKDISNALALACLCREMVRIRGIFTQRQKKIHPSQSLYIHNIYILTFTVKNTKNSGTIRYHKRIECSD